MSTICLDTHNPNSLVKRWRPNKVAKIKRFELSDELSGQIEPSTQNRTALSSILRRHRLDQHRLCSQKVLKKGNTCCFSAVLYIVNLYG
jgi:hypothetical protein